ncbi:MAG: hypothetical protein V4819_21230 [Verrucomicrobiota bacterium]
MLSLMVNIAILGLAGFTILKTQIFRKSPTVSVSQPQQPPSDTTVKILLEMAAASPSPQSAAATAAKPSFMRTSDDQTAPAPGKTPFIGERNTQATSDRSPDPTAPPLPSQAGIDRDDLETTVSSYQDGKLGSSQPAKPQESMPTPPSPEPAIPDPAMAANSSAGEKLDNPGNDDSKSSPPPADKLLEGPSQVDVPVPRNPAEKTAIKPTPLKRPKDGTGVAKAAADAPKPAEAKSAADPGFKGYQRKSAIVGSISRTGRSALDVADSPLGRYQAVISRAVELEWQRNCVRHRDFITPGFLTVRFFVETSGKVRTVQFVGTMETGEVQKGFTLSAIRDADIPAMPAAVKKDFDKEPLELIFNFYF